MRYKTLELSKIYQQHSVLFNQIHVKLHTAKAVYHALTNILTAVREGANHILVLHFDSDINKAVRVAWNEQKEIGWDQTLKGRISKLWGRAQTIYYRYNTLLHDSRIYNENKWVTKTVGSFIDFTLGMWKERCDSLHGANETENKVKKKIKILKMVQRCYDEMDNVDKQFQHLYCADYEEISKRSGQYLSKWLETGNMVRKIRGNPLVG